MTQSRVLCVRTLNYIANKYGDVDWAAPMVTVYDLAFLAVDESFQNKIDNQYGFIVIL
jgi:hypothetical protein